MLSLSLEKGKKIMVPLEASVGFKFSLFFPWCIYQQGIKANITFVYLSRTLGWEQQLPSDLRKQIQPELDPSNPSNLIDKGTFKNFPNINTYLQVNPSVSLANMISHMCGWIVKHNQDFFRLALGI